MAAKKRKEKGRRMNKVFDFIVVGAGINGLQLAALLAHDGNKVLVLEKTGKIGGRAFLLEKDGYTVDYGVHLVRFGPQSSLAQTLRHLGRTTEFVKLGTSYVKDADGRMKIFPTGPSGFLKSEMFTLGERIDAIKIMMKVRKQKFGDLMETSVLDWMDRIGLKGGMRRYFALVSASMMVCPLTEKASIGELLVNMQKVLKTRHSAEYPALGWKPVFKTIEDKINSNGEIRVSTGVEEILIKGGKAVGVKVKGDTIEAKNVVINIPVQEIFSVLDEKNFDGSYVSLCKNEYPTSGVFVDLGLKRKISDMSGLIYTWDPMTFGLFTSNLSPSVAPPGKQLLTWFFPTSLEDMAMSDRARSREESLWQAIRSVFPGIESDIEWKRVSKLKMIDGVQVNTAQTEYKRPGPRVPGIQNLYLVGDSTAAPGAGGDVGNESVHVAYKAITGREV